MPYDIPRSWTRAGLVLPRAVAGPGAAVVGDPCVVWDEDIGGWRMFLFMAPPGHGQATCPGAAPVGPGRWGPLLPLQFTNPEALSGGGTHKPYVVMDAHRPNRAARVDGRFWLLVVSNRAGHKLVQRAWSSRLAGPWTVEPGELIPPGAPGEFDAKHIDAVSGLYFEQRREFLYFYMGYPDRAQARAVSPYGSAQAVAVQGKDERGVRKLGAILPPAQEAGHWASGWVGGLQALPGRKHRWIAVVNASPTAPDPGDRANSREEPPPSLAGFAFCDQDWPVAGWQWAPEPIEWIDALPLEATAAGEGVNLWRQHLLTLSDGRLALIYNSGPYGQEQLYMKISADPVAGD